VTNLANLRAMQLQNSSISASVIPAFLSVCNRLSHASFACPASPPLSFSCGEETQDVGLESVGETDFGKAGPRRESDGNAGPCDDGGIESSWARAGATMKAIRTAVMMKYRISSADLTPV
jgi:hypothetical protein